MRREEAVIYSEEEMAEKRIAVLIAEIKNLYQKLLHTKLKRLDSSESDTWRNILVKLLELDEIYNKSSHTLPIETIRKINDIRSQYESIEGARRKDKNQTFGEVLIAHDIQTIEDIDVWNPDISADMIQNTIDELIDIINTPGERGRMFTIEDLEKIYNKIEQAFEHSPLRATEINTLDNEGYRKKLETLKKFIDANLHRPEITLGLLHEERKKGHIKSTTPPGPIVPNPFEKIT